MLRRLLLPLAALLALVLVPAVALGKKEDKLPNVTPTRVVDVTSTAATVQADVNTRGLTGRYVVEWGTTDAFGAGTTEMPLPAWDGNQPVAATLTGLAPATTYVVHVVATNDNGSDAGAPVTFTTLPAAQMAPPATGPAPKGEDKDRDTGNGGGDGNGKPGDTPGGRHERIPAPDLRSGPVATPADAVLGKEVVVGAVRGTVKVKVRGADGYSELGPGATVPVGSVVDATRGTMRLTTALGGDGTQAALLRGAKFEVRQARAGSGMTALVLRGGDFSACRRDSGGTTAHAARRKHKRAPRRSLWAKDSSGRFATHGRHSVATVRGTEWRTTDTCRGTTTSVARGAVLVRDLRGGRRVLVRAGERHLAPARR